MHYMLNHPRILAIVCALAMWSVALLGVCIRHRSGVPDKEDKPSLAIVLSATLTLLGLIIGFTFSMATSRYDQRRLFEAQEADAIGTEFLRAELLPAPATAAIQHLLIQYLDARIDFYTSDYGAELNAIDLQSAALQQQLWHRLQPQAAAQPNPVTALVLSGMTDVLNSQGYTQFSWWNRIPVAAWTLMILIALLANTLVGYSTDRSRSGRLLLLVLPILIATSFFLIADIDSPRGGVIRLTPRDLRSLSQSLHQQLNQPATPGS